MTAIEHEAEAPIAVDHGRHRVLADLGRILYFHTASPLGELGGGLRVCTALADWFRGPGASCPFQHTPETIYGEADRSGLAVSFSRLALGARPHRRSKLGTSTIRRPPI